MLEWWQKIPLSLLKGYEGWVRSAICSSGGDRIVMASGDEAAYWNGKTDTGEVVSSGTYFYQIQAGAYIETRKMVILK